MSIKTFWNIVIKMIGLLLLFNCISIFSQFFPFLNSTDGDLHMNYMLPLYLMFLGIFFIYILLIWLLIFKSDWLIKVLKLENNFTEEHLNLDIKSVDVLRISIILIGGLIIIDSLPALCLRLFTFLNQKYLFKDYPNSGWLIFCFIKIIIGYLLFTNNKIIAVYIDKKSKQD